MRIIFSFTSEKSAFFIYLRMFSANLGKD